MAGAPPYWHSRESGDCKARALPPLENPRQIPIFLISVRGTFHHRGQDRGRRQGWRLDRALAAAVPTLSRERLKALICGGAVLGPEGALVRDPAVKAIAGGTYAVSVPEPEAGA